MWIYNSAAISQQQIEGEINLPAFPPAPVVRKKLEEQFPVISWKSASSGRIESADFCGEVSIDHEQTLSFQVTGGKDPVSALLNCCHSNSWTAYTPENGLILHEGLDTLKYWHEYITYSQTIQRVFYSPKAKGGWMRKISGWLQNLYCPVKNWFNRY